MRQWYLSFFLCSSSIKCTRSSGFNDIGFGKGWKPGSVKTVQFRIDSYSNVHSIGLYVWTKNPLVEYDITVRGTHSGTSLGSFSSYGCNWNGYKYQRVNKPSIEGIKTFWQYKNYKTSQAGTGGTMTIPMQDHVNFRKSKGLSFGSVYDTLVECKACSGPGSCQLTIGSGGNTTTTSSGGVNSEWLHCNDSIEFGNVSY